MVGFLRMPPSKSVELVLWGSSITAKSSDVGRLGALTRDDEVLAADGSARTAVAVSRASLKRWTSSCLEGLELLGRSLPRAGALAARGAAASCRPRASPGTLPSAAPRCGTSRSPSEVTTCSIDSTSPSEPAGSEISNLSSPSGVRLDLGQAELVDAFADDLDRVRDDLVAIGARLDASLLLGAVEVEREAERRAAAQVLTEADAPGRGRPTRAGRSRPRS